MNSYPPFKDARILQPRDPLICRDGRPFDAGLRGRTLGWPYPSVVIGTARTALIEDSTWDEHGHISCDESKRLLAVRHRGPLPAYRDGAQWKLALPAPADAAPAEDPTANSKDERIFLHPQRPLAEGAAFAAGAGTDLELHGLTHGLTPALAKGLPDSKPPKTPAFWKLETFQKWLAHEGDAPVTLTPSRDALSGPARDYRVHVSILPDSQTADDGALFSTEGLDFGRQPGKDEREQEVAQDEGQPDLALYSEFAVPKSLNADRLRGMIPLGGERRMAAWQQQESLLAGFDPAPFIAQVRASRRLRLVLLTPAWFQHGWLPQWLRQGRLPLENGSGEIALKLVSAVLPRLAPISGWNLHSREPKPTRFLAPAGAVYFCELKEAPDEEKLRSLWLSHISEEPDSPRSLRADGFGLTVFGSWNSSTVVCNK